VGGDLRYAFRALRNSSGFACIAVLTLALGIGANTAIFTVANALLLRTLPYAHPDRLVLLSGGDFDRDGGYGRISYPLFREIRDHARSYDGVAACTYDMFNLTGHGDPQEIESARASWNLFELLGVRPLVGRTFSPEEDRPGGANVVLLSYEFATRLFGDPARALGQNLALDSRDYSVIGVLRPSFMFALFGPRREIWAPRPFEMNLVTPARVELGGTYFNVLGRLNPGVSRDQARAELEVLYGQYRRDKPGNFDATLNLQMQTPDLQSQLVGDVRPTVLILSAAVALLLLIACANVASLFLSRAAGRRKEFAVRAALGGSRAMLTRQLLTESVVISAASGVIGIALGYLGTRLLATFSQMDLQGENLSMDGRVLAFTLAISIASGIVCGLAPAIHASKTDVNRALRDESRGAAGSRRGNRVRAILVIAQVALSMVLLVGAGLLVRSFIRLRNSPLGFDPKNVLTMHMTLLPSHYSQPAQMTSFYRRALDAVKSVPGIEGFALSTALPDSWTHSTPMLFEGQSAVTLGRRPIEALQQVSPDYLKVMRIPLIAGRMFDDGDDEKSQLVALVNQSAARKYWPNESALGKRIWVGTMQNPFQVVGVIGDTKNRGIALAPSPEVFMPYPQLPFVMLQLHVRTAGDPRGVASAVRARLLTVDRDEPVTEVQTMGDYLESLSAPARSTMILLGVFSAVALVLAVVGLYGVVVYSVAQRQQELGIRMALGAARGDIFRLVIGNGLAITLAGIGIGAAGSIALTRMMAGLLYETTATDPVTFAASAALFAATACAASYFPARRAARIDPGDALRSE